MLPMRMSRTAITEVWRDNFKTQMTRLDKALFKYKVVSIDTEFPGCFRETPRDSSELERYEDLKFNVDSLKLIQLGVTLSDEEGNLCGTWQFNFSFNLAEDLHVCESVNFLKNNGIDFDKNREKGIDRLVFAKMLTNVVVRHRDLRWVTFHGLYDLALTVKFLMKKKLPDSLLNFTGLLGAAFGQVADVKYMARFWQGLRGGELGLGKLAKLLEIERIGVAHQAGSDSLLTARAYAKMKSSYQIDESVYVGFLYGIETQIYPSVGSSSPLPHNCNPYSVTSVPIKDRVVRCSLGMTYKVRI